MTPTPYPDLNRVLAELVSGLQRVLGDKLVGVYLQGSFAVGDFDEHSDVDWIAAIADPLTEDEVGRLQDFHPRLYAHPVAWAQHLEGSYFPLEVLRDYQRSGEPLWYLDNGAQHLIESDHCNTALVRWVVREMGVTLVGPPPQTLVERVPVEALRAHILSVIHGWGPVVLETDAFHNRFYQGFIVLNFCRMLHDLHQGYPGSKRAGAEWAKATLDPKWRGLIDRAWDCRPDPATSVRQPPDPDDMAATLELVRLVMDLTRPDSPG